MKLQVIIQANAKNNQIINAENNIWKIKIKALAQDGRANEELIKFLANHFQVPKSEVKIIHGFNSKFKLLEIKLQTD